MTITKDQMARDLVDKTGYYLKDIRCLLSAMDELIKEYFAQVTDNEDVSIQIAEGIKCGCKVMKDGRIRRNPKTGEEVVCTATVKPFTKFSMTFRDTIQKQYEDKK